jgi:hypothetical protein
VLYRDKLGGMYEAVTVREAPAGSRGWWPPIDNDSLIDVAHANALLLGGERWPKAVETDAPEPPLRRRKPGPAGPDRRRTVHRNLGEGRFEPEKRRLGW